MNTQIRLITTTRMPESTMSDDVFAAVVDRLLNTHYGIGLIDTDAGNDGEIARTRAQIPTVRPLELAQEIADDAALDRVDCCWSYSERLNEADEASAIEAVLATTRTTTKALH